VFLSLPICCEYIIIEFLSLGINFYLRIQVKFADTLKNVIQPGLMKCIPGLIKSVRTVFIKFFLICHYHTLELCINNFVLVYFTLLVLRSFIKVRLKNKTYLIFFIFPTAFVS
jgi:hypothetical protein